jgi:hypothetical protein
MRRAGGADECRRFVIAETISAGVMGVVAILATATLHAEIFAAVLLLFAGMMLGHALAIHLGLAHPPGARNDRDRGSPR